MRSEPLDRRTFLALAGAGVAGAALPGVLRAEGAAARLDAIGIQLYTLRSLLARDFEGTLSAVAAIGYREVEFAGYFDHQPPEVRRLLDRLGLRAPAAHVAVEALERDPGPVLDAARTIGHEYVVVAWLDADRRNTLDALKRSAEGFNRIGEAARKAGLRFAYHNHNPEFSPIEGRLPYDVFLENTDPRLVWYEMDLYWITLGGGDPLAYFARWPGRFPMVHVKDMGPPPEHRMVDVGAGTINWAALFAHRKQAGIRHYFVEHDNPADPLATARASYRYLRALRF